MGRSKWKLKYFSNETIKYLLKLKTIKNYNISSKALFFKVSNIPNEFINQLIFVYKGKNFRKLKINKFLVGFRFGNFVMTRKPFNFPLKSKQVKRK